MAIKSKTKAISMKISTSAMGYAAHNPDVKPQQPYIIPKPAPGVLSNPALAMDSDPFAATMLNYISGYGIGDGNQFPGYVALSELAIRPEFRRMASTLSQEMTRKWCKLRSKGEKDLSGKIKELWESMEDLRVREVFREAAEHDALYGISHIYIDNGSFSNPNELVTPLAIRKEKVSVGSIKFIKTIEPIWCYPTQYNSSNPLAPDFYKPTQWQVMGKTVHGSRLLQLVSREVGDILKPSYMFGGVSLTQLARPYVDNWLQTRDSVSELVKSFTVWVMGTNMAATLQSGGAKDIADRADLFNYMKNSRGLMIIDKETEELKNISAQLGGLKDLQAQAQEHMASVDGMPLIILLGITPSGLNATAEPEIKAWHQRVSSQQHHLFDEPMRQILDLLQLNLWGEIEPGITFDWEPLGEVSETERSEIRSKEANTDKTLIEAGIILPDEARARLVHDEMSGYNNLDLDRFKSPNPEDIQKDTKNKTSKYKNKDTD